MAGNVGTWSCNAQTVELAAANSERVVGGPYVGPIRRSGKHR